MKGIKLVKGIVIGAAGAMVTALILGTIAAAMIHGGIIPMGLLPVPLCSPSW